MKKTVTVFLVAILVLTACGRPSSGNDEANNGDDGSDKKTLRITYLVSEEQSTHLAAEDFKEKIENESDGQLEVELYPNGSLYDSDREAIEAVQLGNIEMTIPAVAALSSFNKKMMVFDLPFLFDDYEDVYSVLDGELGQELLSDLEEKDLKGLVFAANGFRHMTNNEGPVESPDDLKGLKLRTMESEVQTDSFKAFGANASPFAFGELYTALQQGTYDAMEQPISLIYTNKFYEVQKYLTLSKHFYAPTALIMNNDFYNNLSDDLQDLVMEASKEYRSEQRELAENQDKKWLEEIKKEGMKVNKLTDEQREEFKKASESVYDKYEDEIGTDVIKRAQEAQED
ncbi:DctP family TRAP transporter solute-binding subunit [Lentibacillus lipolyticus]|nr:DctP family TRAP transporter solute-binding subunit [Lentibacillus lipolyticus]